MTARKKTKGKNKWKKLPPEEKKIVEIRLMAAAEAHRLASFLCEIETNKYDPESYNATFLRIVSFQFTLVSVEQSLRSLLLVLFSIFPEKPNHDLYCLYKTLQEKSADEEEISREIIRRINDCAQTKKMSLISEISEKELEDCLEKHRFSYSDIKYFQVGKNGKLSKEWGFEGHERQIFYCLAVALIELNMYEKAKRDYNILLGYPLEQEVPEEEFINSAKHMGFLPFDNT